MNCLNSNNIVYMSFSIYDVGIHLGSCSMSPVVRGHCAWFRALCGTCCLSNSDLFKAELYHFLSGLWLTQSQLKGQMGCLYCAWHGIPSSAASSSSLLLQHTFLFTYVWVAWLGLVVWLHAIILFCSVEITSLPSNRCLESQWTQLGDSVKRGTTCVEMELIILGKHSSVSQWRITYNLPGEFHTSYLGNFFN